MEKAYLDCSLREEVGKNKLNALRRMGFVPAVVYGKKSKTMPIKLVRSHLIKFIHAHHGIENMVITLRIEDDEKTKKSKEEPVLIKDIQYDPVKDDILHLDFNQISLTETLKVKVPLDSKGEAEGVKKEGGVLTHVLWDLEVECLPTQIPEKIEVDITAMKIGDTIFVKDIKVPEGVKVLTDKESIVFTLLAPKKEEVIVEAAAAEAVSAEPEVIKEKKKEEEGEEKEAKKEKPEAKEAKKEKPEAKKAEEKSS